MVSTGPVLDDWKSIVSLIAIMTSLDLVKWKAWKMCGNWRLLHREESVGIR